MRNRIGFTLEDHLGLGPAIKVLHRAMAQAGSQYPQGSRINRLACLAIQTLECLRSELQEAVSQENPDLPAKAARDIYYGQCEPIPLPYVALEEPGPQGGPGGWVPGHGASSGKVAPRLLLTSRETAKALSTSEKTLYTLTKQGDIPAVRFGRSVRYDLEDLRQWIKRRLVRTGNNNSDNT